MTRNQAILEAIDLLSKDASNEEIVLKLKEIQSEMPLSRWTKNSVLDAIEDYSITHGNILPPTIELKKENNLPSDTVIESLFGYTSMKEFFRDYFPHIEKRKPYTPYSDRGENFYEETFRDNYEKIGKLLNLNHVGIKDYEKYREKDTPSITTILRNLNVQTYNNLLYKMGFKEPDKPISSSLSISYNDSKTSNEDLKKMINEFKKKS